MTREYYLELLDGWRDGFIPQNALEANMQKVILECLEEIANKNGWSF